MKHTPGSAAPSFAASNERRRLAQRVADAHRGIDDSTLLSFVSGSVVDGLADERSDVDISIAMTELPERALLEQACQAAGASPWILTSGDLMQQQLLAAMLIDGIEVQLTYVSHDLLQQQIDELVLRHNPDTPLHQLADALLKAEPLFGERRLRALQVQLSPFPAPLALAMARHFSAPPTPWKVMAQIVERDAPLWCRDLQVQACYRLLGLMSAVNGRYYSRLQNKRLHQLAGSFELAPPGLADRIESLLAAPPRAAAAALHALEGDVLLLLAQRFPELELDAVHQRRAQFTAG
ncbi:MAG: hypothetical protein IPH51_11305 [Rubrivivax sp.]|nr:hypothetical protein [Rubrivivax sp.]